MLQICMIISAYRKKSQRGAGGGVEIEIGNESLMTYQAHIFIGRSTMKRCSASVTVIPATTTIIPNG